MLNFTGYNLIEILIPVAKEPQGRERSFFAEGTAVDRGGNIAVEGAEERASAAVSRKCKTVHQRAKNRAGFPEWSPRDNYINIPEPALLYCYLVLSGVASV